MLHTSLLLENIDLSGATHYKRLSACCISNPYGNIENVTGTDICFWSPYYFTKTIKEQRQSTLVNRCIHFSKLCHVDSCSMSFQFLNQLTLCCTLFNPSKLCRIQNMHGQPSLFNEWRTNSGYIISIKLQHLATTLVIQNISLTKRCLGKNVIPVHLMVKFHPGYKYSVTNVDSGNRDVSQHPCLYSYHLYYNLKMEIFNFVVKYTNTCYKYTFHLKLWHQIL